MPLLPSRIWLNLAQNGDEITAEVFTDQRTAALAIDRQYIQTIFAIECRGGWRNLGHCDLRGLWDADDQAAAI
ncbi:MAG: hypothetical protein QGG19_19145 [Alphaproteobacteria bacterium]|nr:hypothetical protein [Alphaproteobacteria bacterium]MDP6257133.1 hypothetical protein [Alphaproteobacteria bacterium]MDP7055278.1 hypothetical protein [Alphaproteobacteria bacterium]MDP7460320.1 hypothetical protein [Alphaproteobacteria bacterium]HJM90939.1 hypothetical protein [Alphaproteobacteria bacterium]|tara:strand:- start:305 stop:523 length:219 start_codon:yes stop_codon:yes gene_type:complete